MAMVALVILGDLVIWQVYPPGIGLALLFLVAGVAVIWLRRARLRNGSVLLSVVLFLCSLLPLVEAPSLLGFLVALTGTTLLALATSHHLPRSFEGFGATLARFAVLAPFRLLGDGVGLLTGDVWKGVHGRILRTLVIWIVPAVFAGAFLLLFAAANPVIEDLLRFIRPDVGIELLHPFRIALWVVLAGVSWPLLRPRLLTWAKEAAIQGPRLPKAESLLFGQAAILRSLIVFNLMFAVQTVMDALYLWGGVRLPDGLSYADYAHRGAYPLIATALLAAAFVLVALRPSGPAQNSVLIRRLVYVWIGQNVLLVISSILRLDLYVQVYSLTEMRIAAGIWMGLVAIGLVLILLRIVWRRSNAWLVSSNLVSLGLTLFVCALIDFSAIIAQFNVENSRDLGGKGQPLDLYYLESLGPSAIPAIAYLLDRVGERDDSQTKDFDILAGNLAIGVLNGSSDWRSWSFRTQRLQDWLRASPRFENLGTTTRTYTSPPPPPEETLSSD